MGRTTIIFAPHPDDETLACGGTVAIKAKSGQNVWIVFMTDGRNSHLHALGISSDPTPGELAHVRKGEATRAAKVLGIKPENTIFLDIEDGTLLMNNETAEARVRQILSELQPDEVYYPDKNDVHKDHSATYTIVENSLKAINVAPKRYRYIVWSSGKESKESAGHQIAVDVTSVLALKKSAISEYLSQTTLFSKQQRRPVLSNSFLTNFERDQELFISESGAKTASTC